MLLVPPPKAGAVGSILPVYEITVTQLDAIFERNSQIGQTRVQICTERIRCSFESKFAPYWHAWIPATVISYTVTQPIV